MIKYILLVTCVVQIVVVSAADLKSPRKGDVSKATTVIVKQIMDMKNENKSLNNLLNNNNKQSLHGAPNIRIISLPRFTCFSKNNGRSVISFEGDYEAKRKQWYELSIANIYLRERLGDCKPGRQYDPRDCGTTTPPPPPPPDKNK